MPGLGGVRWRIARRRGRAGVRGCSGRLRTRPGGWRQDLLRLGGSRLGTELGELPVQRIERLGLAGARTMLFFLGV